MVVVKHRGNFKNLETLMSRSKKLKYDSILEKYAREGVAALSAATPVDSGKTASAWDYKIEISAGASTISWTNSNVNKGVPIAILLQYGHGTGTGGFVQGRDYINPTLAPIFDKLASDVWKEVTK